MVINNQCYLGQTVGHFGSKNFEDQWSHVVRSHNLYYNQWHEKYADLCPQ